MLDLEKDDKDLEAGTHRAYEESDIQPRDEEEAISTFRPITQEKPQNELPPATKVVTVQDWDGPSDPENPQNWSLLKKSYHTAIPGLYGFAVTIGSAMYAPAVGEIMEKFNVSETAALVGLSVYVIGLGFGPVLAAPVSESLGRSIVYRTTLPVSMLFTLGAGFSNSFAALLVCRFFAGFFGSPVLAVGAGTNADIWPPRQRAIATSFFLMAPFAGPALGPFIGGFAAQYKGWRWTQWCILFISLAAWIPGLFMSETYKKILLKRRAANRGLEGPKGLTGVAAIKFLFAVTLIRPVHMLVTEPIVLFLSLYTAFAFSVLFAFFAAFPVVFEAPPYNFTVSQTGLTFLGIGLGVVISSFSAVVVDRTVYQKKYRQAIAEGRKHAAPEHRLYVAMMGSIGLPVGLFWFAWTADNGVHWAVPVVGAIPFAWGNLNLFIATALYLIDVYGPLNGASALAANGILRYTLGAAFPLFTVQMYDNLGIGWATSLLGFLAVAMLPIPWVLFKWGPQIRARSQYPTDM
ncbi:MFS general substrate transporter [Mytilinidion resinicola]|uniref:MFS general substrate transporter n=1 Tax=Mytilinidion resinicola TaxID=574789 RepID=A0A6A6Z6K8_9PEZI|nr:MFS general substrate transporter [Mytilinidion resinicola]KAF2816742.1 MFS general substrate transporter [Mytilinidion resinicola]